MKKNIILGAAVSYNYITAAINKLEDRELKNKLDEQNCNHQIDKCLKN